MHESVKFSVSIPEHLYLVGERERRRRGLSRSAYIAELYRAHMRLLDRELLLREYEEAYRGRPDTEEELAFADAAVAELFSESD
jgi:hypothetical protein